MIDTGLKTKDTGNMHRHMIKAFENIVSTYDGSVRSTIGTLVGTSYNHGYKVESMIPSGKRPCFIDVRHVMRELNHKRGFIKESTGREISGRPVCHNT